MTWLAKEPMILSYSMSRNPLRTLNVTDVGTHKLQNRDAKCRRLPSSILGSGKNVFVDQCERNSCLLNGGGPLEALFVDSRQQLSREMVVLKFHIFLCLRHILQRRRPCEHVAITDRDIGIS